MSAMLRTAEHAILSSRSPVVRAISEVDRGVGDALGKRGRQMLIRGPALSRAEGSPPAVNHVVHQLQAAYGQVSWEDPGDDDPALRLLNSGDHADKGHPLDTGHVAHCRLELRRAIFYPIKTWREFDEDDPLRVLLGAFRGLEPGELLCLQTAQLVLLRPAPDDWSDAYQGSTQPVLSEAEGAEGPRACPTAESGHQAHSVASGRFQRNTKLLRQRVPQIARSPPAEINHAHETSLLQVFHRTVAANRLVPLHVHDKTRLVQCSIPSPGKRPQMINSNRRLASTTFARTGNADVQITIQREPLDP